jgi:hypothetical protein
MAGNSEEPNRFLGVPQRPEYLSQGNEEQHFLGVPVSSLGAPNPHWLDYLKHPVARFKRWLRRRKLGPYAPD